MGLRALLDRAWSGITAGRRAPTAAELFRTADRLRQEGRYSAAAELVTEGLRRSPCSPAGHILDAYLRLAFRQGARARDAFTRALALDPEHPRALLGLARISLDEGDADAAQRYLARALEYHPEFPEARELEARLARCSPRLPRRPPAPAARRERIPLPPGGRDMVLTQLTGEVLLARCERARQPGLTRQATEIVRLAAPLLARAGLGRLRRGLVEGAIETVFLRADPSLVLSIALPATTGVRSGLVEVDRLWAHTSGDSA